MALRHLQPGETVNLRSKLSSAAGKSVALVKTDGFEAAQLQLMAGSSIARHSVPGFATIQCLDGEIVLETDRPIVLQAGDWLYLDRGEEHSVRAISDGSLLLTILFD